MELIENIFLLHGKGGRPTGSVLQLEELLRPDFPGARFRRPALLHGDTGVAAEQSLRALHEIEIPAGSTVIGISLGGLLAARLQETVRIDLQVIAISSPTWADGVSLAQNMPHRLALYSSKDTVILGRVTDWPRLAEAYDLPWLTHDTDAHKHPLVRIVRCYLRGENVCAEVGVVTKELRCAEDAAR
ncbi:MAG TPA: hypothetical protein VME86_16540 [Acidobacteriaceae bacterium]|nr:hypothetical protein [Acidobacteriaceae bacterium]